MVKGTSSKSKHSVKKVLEGSQKSVKKVHKPSHEMQFKSNIGAIKNLLRSLKLTNKHKAALKKTPFWLFFRKIMHDDHEDLKIKKNENVICDIIQSYDDRHGCFRIGKKKIQLNETDIALIFGVVSGARNMKIKRMAKPKTNAFVISRFEKVEHMKSINIKAALHEAINGDSDTDAADVAKLIMLYACLTLFFSTRADLIPWAFINYVDDLDNAKRYNWSKGIADHLLDSIKKNHNDPRKVIGCVTVLPYWFCEHTKVFPPLNSKLFPRFLKWDITRWPKDFKAQYIDTLRGAKAANVIEGELMVISQEAEALNAQQAISVSDCHTSSPTIAESKSGPVNDNSHAGSSHGVQKKLFEIDSTPVAGQHTAQLHEVPMTSPRTQNKIHQSHASSCSLNDALQKIKNLEQEKDASNKDIEQLQIEIAVQMKEKEKMQHDLDDVRNALSLKNNEMERLHAELHRLICLNEESEKEKSHIHAEFEKLKRETENIMAMFESNNPVVADPVSFQEVVPAPLMLEDASPNSVAFVQNSNPKSVVTVETPQVEVETKKRKNDTPSMIRRVKLKTRVPKLDSDFEYDKGKRPKAHRKHENEIDEKEFEICDVETYKAAEQSVHPMQIDPKSIVKTYTTSEDMAMLRDIARQGKDNVMVWFGQNFLLWNDLARLINCDMVSDNLINAYAEHLTLIQARLDPELLISTQTCKSFVVTSSCMTFLRMNRHDLVKKHMTDKLRASAGKFRYFIFPLLSKGNHESANHWTLLVLDTDEGIWLHYNSILPRSKRSRDPYLKDAKTIVEYYESIFDILDPSQQLKPKIHTQWGTPQQSETSVDCGVICMYIMDSYFKQREIPQKLSQDELLKYRAWVIHTFLNDKKHGWCVKR